MGILPPGMAASDIIARPGPIPTPITAASVDLSPTLMLPAYLMPLGGAVVAAILVVVSALWGMGRMPLPALLLAIACAIGFIALGWWNAIRDVAAREQQICAAEALRHAEGVYHSLVETLPQRIFRKDLEGRFTFANGNYCRSRNRPLAEIVGKSDFDFSPPDLARRYRHDDQKVVQTGHTLDIVEEYVKTDGTRRYIHTIKTPVFGPEGAIIGVQGIHWDITDRKMAEQELERKNGLLIEAAEAERAARIDLQKAHEELKRAQSRLVQSEKLAGLGQMVAGVAHEINNPLAFVGNNIAVLQRDVRSLVDLLGEYRKADGVIAGNDPALSASLREIAERIDLEYTQANLNDLLTRSRDGMRRIQQIVNDLRHFARLDESDLHEADLNAGIESTLNIVMGTAKARHVLIEKQLNALPPVSCYPAKINQVVMNLVTNAIDASRDGGRIIVRTSLVRTLSPEIPIRGPAARIEVIDEGMGIPPENRSRIFDPFFTTKAPGQGTGLGLSISYGIIQDHGGTIDVESTPGKGSDFIVTLPVTPIKKH